MTSLNNVVMKLYTLTPIPTRCPNVAVFITNLLIDTKFTFLKCQWIFSLLARLVFFPISPTRRFSFLCHLQDCKLVHEITYHFMLDNKQSIIIIILTYIYFYKWMERIWQYILNIIWTDIIILCSNSRCSNEHKVFMYC